MTHEEICLSKDITIVSVQFMQIGEHVLDTTAKVEPFSL